MLNGIIHHRVPVRPPVCGQRQATLAELDVQAAAFLLQESVRAPLRGLHSSLALLAGASSIVGFPVRVWR